MNKTQTFQFSFYTLSVSLYPPFLFLRELATYAFLPLVLNSFPLIHPSRFNLPLNVFLLIIAIFICLSPAVTVTCSPVLINIYSYLPCQNQTIICEARPILRYHHQVLTHLPLNTKYADTISGTT